MRLYSAILLKLATNTSLIEISPTQYRFGEEQVDGHP
jgi:hypothetical protein